MRVRFESITLYVCVVIVLAALSGGFLASVFNYFVSKEMCKGLLEGLAYRLGDRELRRSHMTRVSLQRKLMVSVIGFSLVTIVFAMFLSLTRSSDPLELNATQTQLAYLEELASEAEAHARAAVPAEGAEEGEIEDAELASGGETVDFEEPDSKAPDSAQIDWQTAAETARRLRIADHILLLDVETGAVLQGPGKLLGDREVELVLASARGNSRGLDSPNAFSWMSLPGGEIVAVAVTPWSVIRGDLLPTMLVFFGAVLACTVISFLLAFCLSRDVGSRINDLIEAAERLASGDLRAMVLLEAEDELGELAHAFESMALALRTTVGGVAEAANLVESTAGEIESITAKIAGGARGQSAGVQSAVSATERMDVQVSGISKSAQELNLLVEESSSSILEMGAAGDELNDTAGVLSSRVEEVSSSVEQMIRSVKEVNSHTGSLSEAATDTSSSMEEMASSMRQVDNIAEEAANLSKRVVDAAEGGRETVRETIEGMESIRQATEAAELVITGLGNRAKEIGSILDVIDDVADETSLLALNAAIIAAQAGEHGRAFSVVADEIKELADRVLASTKEIGDLIRSVQQESENAIGAISKGAESVATGVERSRGAGSALDEITEASRESGQRIQEIVRAIQEQSRAASHVVEMMEKVNAGVDAIHAAAGEQDKGNEIVYRSTIAMREVSQQLRATTEEQARGGARIRESIDGVRDAAESINDALNTQSASCQEVVGFLEEVSAGNQANDVSSSRLEEASRSLMQQAESLREGVKKFVLDI
jgi:methyl-accepting chemotaxis protein